ELERAIAAASTHDARDTRLGTLVQRLGVDPIAGGLLVAALAYAIDLDTRELVHALAARRKPALYLDTCVDVLQIDAQTLLQAVALGAPLRRGRVLALDG